MAQLDLFATAQMIPNLAPGLHPEYFNTTKLTGTVLKERQFRAGSQNDMILKYVKAYNKPFTPWFISTSLNLPIRSAARSITTLTIMGYLEKMDGKEGRPLLKTVECQGEENFCWRIK